MFDFGNLFQFYYGGFRPPTAGSCSAFAERSGGGGVPRGFRPLRRDLVRLLPSEASQLRSGGGGVGGGEGLVV